LPRGSPKPPAKPAPPPSSSTTPAVDVVANYGDALAGKILIDITNPFNDDASALVTTAGNSMSQQIAAAPPRARTS
jgi:predicted dinucleotide-binding enzyme